MPKRDVRFCHYLSLFPPFFSKTVRKTTLFDGVESHFVRLSRRRHIHFSKQLLRRPTPHRARHGCHRRARMGTLVPRRTCGCVQRAQVRRSAGPAHTGAPVAPAIRIRCTFRTAGAEKNLKKCRVTATSGVAKTYGRKMFSNRAPATPQAQLRDAADCHSCRPDAFH